MKLFNLILKYSSLAAMIIFSIVAIVDSKATDITSGLIPTIVCAAIYIGCVIKERDLK